MGIFAFILKENPLDGGPQLFSGSKYTQGLAKSQYSKRYIFLFPSLTGALKKQPKAPANTGYFERPLSLLNESVGKEVSHTCAHLQFRARSFDVFDYETDNENHL